jgi:hypothetical protein
MRTSFRVLTPSVLLALVAASTLAAPRRATAVEFERVVIDDDFPGAYQVEVADVNGDRRPDIVAVGGGTCAWYENPSWKKRIVTTPKQTPGIISSATADLDGDGKAEIAIAFEFAMNEPAKGKLLLATQEKGIDDPWTVTPVADIGSIHRLRWGCVIGTPRVLPNSVVFDKRLELIVAPIFGPSAKPPAFEQEPAHLVVFTFTPRDESKLPAPAPGGGNLGGGLGGATGGLSRPADPPVPVLHGKWNRLGPQKIGDAPVLHAIDVIDLDGNGFSDVLGASNLGVTLFEMVGIIGAPTFRSQELAPGAPGDAPKKGASEVHVGRLKDGRRFLTTVEPWHGTDVAVYLSESLNPLKFGPRTVIDSTLKEGHALWVADVDGDGDDEVFAGYRGPGTSVLMFDFNGKTWDRTVVDPAIAAQDLRGGDLDGDGTPDVVAVGGKTHNVIWYKFRANPGPR